MPRWEQHLFLELWVSQLTWGCWHWKCTLILCQKDFLQVHGRAPWSSSVNLVRGQGGCCPVLSLVTVQHPWVVCSGGISQTPGWTQVLQRSVVVSWVLPTPAMSLVQCWIRSLAPVDQTLSQHQVLPPGSAFPLSHPLASCWGTPIPLWWSGVLSKMPVWVQWTFHGCGTHAFPGGHSLPFPQIHVLPGIPAATFWPPPCSCLRHHSPPLF